MPNDTKAAAAALTVAIVPRIPALGALNQAGPVAKIGAGGAIWWFTRNRKGQIMMIVSGVGIGLAVDGFADLLVGA